MLQSIRSGNEKQWRNAQPALAEWRPIPRRTHPGVVPLKWQEEDADDERASLMNPERALLSSIVFLVLGLGLIFGYRHGTVAFSAAYPVSGASLEIAINTTGLAAMAGFDQL